MRVLVTGGAGFIGSHLLGKLLGMGHDVRVLDDFSTGKEANLPASVEVIRGCVTDAEVVARAVAGVDAVAHLAAIASVQASVDEPVHTHEVNFRGTLNVLEAMRQNGVRRLVYASSAAVYGNECEPPVREDVTLQPLTPYAADKLSGEFYADFYRRQYALETGIFRFFNVYGPRQDPSSPYSGVISIFFDRLLAGAPVTIFGDGEQTRDFVYVVDLVEILAAALCADPPAAGTVNVGTALSTSVNELYGQIARLVGVEEIATHAAPRDGEVRHSRADITRLTERFPDLLPKTTMQRGLQDLLASLRGD